MAAGEAGREPETHSSTCVPCACVCRAYIHISHRSLPISPESVTPDGTLPALAPARTSGHAAPQAQRLPAAPALSRSRGPGRRGTAASGQREGAIPVRPQITNKKLSLIYFVTAAAPPPRDGGGTAATARSPRPRRKTRPNEGMLCRPEAERHMREHLGLGNLTEVLRPRDASCPLFVERSPSRTSQRR